MEILRKPYSGFYRPADFQWEQLFTYFFVGKKTQYYRFWAFLNGTFSNLSFGWDFQCTYRSALSDFVAKGFNKKSLGFVFQISLVLMFILLYWMCYKISSDFSHLLFLN
jgi:hypothetical protein